MAHLQHFEQRKLSESLYVSLLGWDVYMRWTRIKEGLGLQAETERAFVSWLLDFVESNCNLQCKTTSEISLLQASADAGSRPNRLGLPTTHTPVAPGVSNNEQPRQISHSQQRSSYQQGKQQRTATSSQQYVNASVHKLHVQSQIASGSQQMVPQMPPQHSQQVQHQPILQPIQPISQHVMSQHPQPILQPIHPLQHHAMQGKAEVALPLHQPTQHISQDMIQQTLPAQQQAGPVLAKSTQSLTGAQPRQQYIQQPLQKFIGATLAPTTAITATAAVHEGNAVATKQVNRHSRQVTAAPVVLMSTATNAHTATIQPNNNRARQLPGSMPVSMVSAGASNLAPNPTPATTSNYRPLKPKHTPATAATATSQTPGKDSGKRVALSVGMQSYEADPSTGLKMNNDDGASQSTVTGDAVGLAAASGNKSCRSGVGRVRGRPRRPQHMVMPTSSSPSTTVESVDDVDSVPTSVESTPDVAEQLVGPTQRKVAKRGGGGGGGGGSDEGDKRGASVNASTGDATPPSVTLRRNNRRTTANYH